MLTLMQYGASMCYAEEIHDKKIIGCKREWNDEIKAIEYVQSSTASSADSSAHTALTTAPRRRVVFQTLPNERVVFQIGTADAISALQAAQVVCNDVRAIDINMGCPKTASVHCGYVTSILTMFSGLKLD